MAWKVGHTAREASSVGVAITMRGWMTVTMEDCCCVMVGVNADVVEACCRDKAPWAVKVVVDEVSSLDW